MKPTYVLRFTPGMNLRAQLEALQKEIIEDALRECGGNSAHAAKILGTNRTTVVEQRRRFNLPIKSKSIDHVPV